MPTFALPFTPLKALFRKTLLLLLPAAAGLTALNGCTKTESVPTDQVCTLTGLRRDGEVVKFTYDPDGKNIIREEDTDTGKTSPFRTVDYVYGTNTITYTEKQGSVTKSVTSANTDAQGRILRETELQGSDSLTYTYTYNSSGALASIISKNSFTPGGSTTLFTYNQGNLYKAAGTDTTIYTYGSDRDKFGGRFDAGKGPFNRYGTANTNLPLTKTQGGVKTSYTYLKNASGYVSKASGLLTTGKLSNSYPACSCK